MGMLAEREMIELAHAVRSLSIQFAMGQIVRTDYQQELSRLLELYTDLQGRSENCSEAARPLPVRTLSA